MGNVDKFKIVKVHSHWKLKEHGYNVALRFDNWDNTVGSFERRIKEVYGPESWFDGRGHWRSHYGKARYTMHPDGYTREYNRPYYIGFKHEADISAALLLMGSL